MKMSRKERKLETQNRIARIENEMLDWAKTHSLTEARDVMIWRVPQEKNLIEQAFKKLNPLYGKVVRL